MAGDLAELGAERLDLRGQPLVDRAQRVGVDADADVLHLGEHPDERVLDRVVELGHPVRIEARLDRSGDVMDGERVAAGPLGRRSAPLPSRSSWPEDGSVVARWRELGELLEQIGELVARLGGVDQVGGDRRVELQPAQVDVGLEQRTHQWLDVVAADVVVRAERLGDRVVARAARPGTQATADVAASITNARPSSALRPGSPSHDAATSSTSTAAIACSRRSGVGEHLDLGDELLAAAALDAIPELGPSASASRSAERPELEEVEQPLHLVGVRRDRECVEVDRVDRSVVPEDHQLEVLASPRLVLGQVLAQLRRLLVDVLRRCRRARRTC